MLGASRIETREIAIPFRFKYGHSRKTHTGVRAVVCMASDDEGHRGWGEAVPRSYVTGENCASVVEAIGEIVAALGRDVASFDDLRRALPELALGWEGAFPSCAFCALEGALLDLEARRRDLPLYRLFTDCVARPLDYTMSVGMHGRAKIVALLLACRAFGFRQYKIKVGRPDDAERVRLVRRIVGRSAVLFADANARWDRETAIREIESLHKQGVCAVEEPLRPKEPEERRGEQIDRESVLDDAHWRDCAWLRERSPVALIADESLISPRSLRCILERGAFDVLNVRLSKCGGFLLASEMVSGARAASLSFVQGAMVGESPILANAGSHFALLEGDPLYLQGHAHRLLHGVRFASGGARLRRGARLAVPPLPGLGLEVDDRALDAVTTRKETLTP